MNGLEVAIRLDTEDFLTPESDLALGHILDVLEGHGARATFPLVGAKLRSWQAGGRGDLVARLRRQAVGYHSDTHSLHPTIAEELAPLAWPEACAAFARRERAGFALVAESFGPPCCFTQPGGNWTAAAPAVLRGWGVPLDFSEAWNSYLDAGPAPCRYGGLLHWSAPVPAPKPFLSGLPDNLPAALRLVEAALGAPERGAEPLLIVAHPTELCTTAFWDAVNFAAGRMPPRAQWRAAPLRPRQEWEAAVGALDAYLGHLERLGATFVTAPDLTPRHRDLASGAQLSPAELSALCGLVAAEFGPVRRGDLALSAAEVFGLLVEALAAAGEGPASPGPGAALAIRPYDGPAAAPPEPPRAASAGRAALVTAARWSRAALRGCGCVPNAVPLGRAVVAPATFAGAAASLLAHPEAGEAPLCAYPPVWEAVVKAPERLHWDWPVFPAGFRPLGLWEMARWQAWTWKPAPRDPRPTAAGESLPWLPVRPG